MAASVPEPRVDLLGWREDGQVMEIEQYVST